MALITGHGSTQEIAVNLIVRESWAVVAIVVVVAVAVEQEFEPGNQAAYELHISIMNKSNELKMSH